MDPVNLQYIWMSSLLPRVFRKKNIYFIAKAQKAQGFRDNLNVYIDSNSHIEKIQGRLQHAKVLM